MESKRKEMAFVIKKLLASFLTQLITVVLCSIKVVPKEFWIGSCLFCTRPQCEEERIRYWKINPLQEWMR